MEEKTRGCEMPDDLHDQLNGRIPYVLVPSPNVAGISNIVLCRIPMFMWPFGPLHEQLSSGTEPWDLPARLLRADVCDPVIIASVNFL